MHTGILPEKPISNSYAPKDFSDSNHHIPWLQDEDLGGELIVDLKN